jgi:hypothetical protein
MLVYIWMCVMLRAFAPGGHHLSDHYVDAVQSYVATQLQDVATTASPAVPLTPTHHVRRQRTSAALTR